MKSLFDIPITPKVERVEKCNTCCHSQRWQCGGSIIDERFKDSFFVYSSGVGIQLLDCDKPFAWEIDEKPLKYQPDMIQLANNDGLSYEDFDKWFDVEKATGQKAIIHFTNFRY